MNALGTVRQGRTEQYQDKFFLQNGAIKRIYLVASFGNVALYGHHTTCNQDN